MKTLIRTKMIVVFLLLVSSGDVYSQLAPDIIYKEAENSILYVQSYNEDGYPLCYGSAVAVSEDGVVYTNFHVYKGSDSIVFECSGNYYTNPLIIGSDPEKDIIIFKLRGYRGGYIKTGNSDSDYVGENIYAFGNPKGYKKSFTSGIINAFRDKEYDFDSKNIQFSAPISGGSSGGALINSKGELIGITSRSVDLQNAQNINFAVPVNYFKEVKTADENDAGQIKLVSDFCKGYGFYLNSSYIRAEEYFANYTAGYPDDIKGLYYRGLNFGNRGQYDSAILYLKKMTEIEPENINAYIGLGEYSYYKGDTLIALEYYNKAYSINPRDVTLLLKRGTFYDYALHDSKLALEDFSRAIAIKTDYNFVYLYRSKVYLEIGDSVKALKDLYASVSKEDIEWTCMERGNIFTELELYDEAIMDYTRAIKLNPYDDSYYSLRGICYMKNSDFINAINDFNYAIKLNSRNNVTISNLGYAYLDLNEYEDAEKWFKRSLLMFDKSFDTYLGLSMVYYCRNEKTKCLTAFNNAVKLEKKLKKGMNGIKKLEEESYFWLNEDKEIINEICRIAGYYYIEKNENVSPDNANTVSGE